MSALPTEAQMERLFETEHSRKTFLKGSGTLLVGFSLAGSLLSREAKAAPARVLAGPPDANRIDSWVAIHSDNTATIAFGKIELGQGTTTGMLQIAAEELDLTMEQVKPARVDTEYSPNQGATVGSTSISGGGPAVRQAAAEARAVLLGLAARELGVAASRLTVDKGVVSGGGRTVTYGQLLGGRSFAAPNTGRAPVKDVSQYKLVGTPQKRVDIPAKVKGNYEFVHNIRLPGMLHARVVRPKGQGPYTQPVKALSIDESSIRNIKGARIVRRGEFLAVVAANEQDAIQAAAQLKVKWSESATMPGHGNLWSFVRDVQTQERSVANTGNVDAALRNATQVLQESYSWPYQGHASFGPSAAVADVRSDGATVMMAGQSVYGTRNTIAGLLGMRADQVRIQFYEGSGCYGKNLQDDPAQAAAVISQIVGKPVRVQLMRWDEHGWDFYGPATLVDIKASVDAAGKITGYDYVSWQQGWNSVETTSETVGTAIPTTPFGGADGPNSAAMYAIPNRRVVGRSIPVGTALPRVAYLRAPAAPQATFASEQMIDELAFVAGKDPVAFRRANLTNERWLGVLNAAAQAANWELRPAAHSIGKGRILKGRGVALGGFSNTHVAVIADVEVDRLTGKIRAKHLTAAHDCGLVINPELVANQVEGCLIQGASRALLEEVRFSKTRVTSLNWESYPILRFKDSPSLTVVLVNRPDQRSSGAGEPATAPVGAAIANAFFDATGKRIRSAPLTPARGRVALKA
jgi:CO/xanthine dehydrogenase Mo-binding subunit